MTTQSKLRTILYVLVPIVCLTTAGILKAEQPDGSSAAQALAREILAETGVRGGLVVHLGCGDGALTAALHGGDAYLVQGLDADATAVAAARKHIRSLGLYGKVSVDRLSGSRLPYIDNLVNLVIAEDLGSVPREELLRVLCPLGVAYVKQNGQWTKTVKPRPAEIDEWTHYLHDASNNAVAHDTVVGPPRRMQWVGSPRYSRHHDRMSSVSAVVSAGGRIFYIIDEAPPASILIAPKWTLVARDAFNGVILWKRRIGRWHTHLWPLKSGPAQLARRLVADGNRVYATLNLDGPLTALDAATGKTIWTYDETAAAEEVIFSDGLLFVLANRAEEKPDYDGSKRFAKAYGSKFWDEAKRHVVAIRADSGEVLWTMPTRVLPATLAADRRRLVLHDGRDIVALDRNTGEELWRSQPVERSKELGPFYLPTLVLYDDVVLFSGGETAGMQTGSWYTSGKDTLTALSVETGKVLWSGYHPPSGYRSPEDLLVVDGLVWTGETTSGRAVGVFTGRDLHTGEVKREFSPDVDTYWFHHRCYRGKATDNYLLMARAGTEFIDVRQKHWIPHHWFRGACSYGVMPANGLIYAPPHPCACYLEAKLYGFNALAPAKAAGSGREEAGQGAESAAARLQRGPAYDAANPASGASRAAVSEDWPTFRHDAARSGHANTSVPAALEPAWQAELGGRLTSPVVAGGKVFVAAVDTHTVHAMDAASGKELWSFTSGGRIDSPPTVHDGRVLLGSADGYVYCLRSTDGALIWRFRAAPIDQRMTAFEQIESVWPVHGSVLVQEETVYCVAGRSMFLDGGLRLLRLDPATGRLLSETVLDQGDPGSADDLQSYVSWLNMPVALPDVLSCDGRLVYMRSQPFQLDGTRLPLQAMPGGENADAGAPPATQDPEHAHLFCPTGLLDDAWWHRSYWMYGSRFVSGWCGYYLSGKAAPAGRILVFDDSKIYGFGRKPQYYKWTTPIEHHLFAADKIPPDPNGPQTVSPRGSRVRVAKSASLNPAGKPLTVAAWAKADKPGGVILARGGSVQGYALYLKGGRPHFAIRSGSELSYVAAKRPVLGRWVRLAGVLTAQKQLLIYVDGRLAASTDAQALVAADPSEAMEIGADEGSAVGDYGNAVGFTGVIDEVRVYHRALSATEVAQSAGAASANVDHTDLVLAFSFDKPDAVDASGNENHGTIENAVPAPGKSGRALQFSGAPSRVPGYIVDFHWTADLPLFARAMVLAGDTLFVAGPPDTVDEDQAFRQIDDPKVTAKLAAQAAALAGNRGATLWSVSVADGKRLAEHRLDAPPVFDGMAAAAGRLYLATTDGRVLCLTGR